MSVEQQGAPMSVAGGAGLGSAAPVAERADRLPALDGYRAAAALMVLGTHVGFQTGAGLNGPFAAVLSRLDFGVTVFFLLSGFLLYTPFTAAHQGGGRRPRVAGYLWRRGLRVLPAYWAALVGAAVLMPQLAGVSTLEWGRQALMLHTVTKGHLMAGMTQTWSLAVEVGFYLALPLLAAAVRVLPGPRQLGPLGRELTLVGVMGAIGLGFTALAHSSASPSLSVAPLWLPGYLDWFALGMLGAVLRTHLHLGGSWGPARAAADAATATGTCLVAAGLFFSLACTPLIGGRGLVLLTPWEAVLRHLLYGGTAAAVLLPIVLGPPSRLGAIAGSRIGRWLGEVSYGVFLWHVLLLSVVLRWLGLTPFTGHALLVAAVLLPLSLAVSTASLWLLERPSLRLRTAVR